MLNRKFYKILIIFCLVFMIGLLAYIYFFDNSIPTIAEELDTGEISKRKALEDLTSIPVRDLVEEEDSFRVVDEKDNIGVEIIYNSHSSNLSYQGEYPEGGRGVNGEGQNETLNSADDGHTPRPNGHPSQEGISDDGDVFQIDFYKDYSKGIEVDLGEGRSFLMKDVSSGDFKVSSLSSAPLNSPLERSTAEQGGVLNREDSSDKLNSNGDGNTPHPSGTPLERGFVKYESKDERKKIYYGYQKDSATGERKLKKWIIYEEPEVSSSQKSKVHKVESVGYEYEEYVFENAKLHKNEDGDVEVFYWGDKEKQNELTMAEVDQSLLARAQRVLARDMGEDFMKNGEPDLIIPKPFYYDKDNNLTYLDWQISEDGHTLILEFRVEENKYPIALDPTLEFTAPGIPEASDVITGEKTSNAFGSSLSVGDLNNDGKNDLVVGAGSHNSYRGRVYIFYQDGGLGDKANMADVIIDGENSSDRFGSHLAIGDLNANGKNDLIVDAYYYNSSQGRVYIFYNDGAYPNTAGLADEIITGEAGIGYFGNSLVIGDFNSNGKIDLVIGAYGYNSSQGRAYIFYNDGIYTNLAASADEIITGEASSNFGIEFTVGDLNVDGKDDLVIGAYGYDASDDEGRVYIFYNDGTGVYVDTAATADEIITGENLSFFGYSLATGDLDADGDTDLVVGGYKYGIFDGRVYIFYNNGTGVYVDTAATADEIITGEDSADRFGFFLTVDDLNMDGKDDLIAGAYLYDITSNEGRVYVYYNDGYYTATSTLADVIITGEGTDSSFGFSFSTGDLNSDGKTDLVVGAQGYNSSQGRVYIFYSQNGQVNLNKSIVGESTSDYFGNAMTSGDFDADGDIDLAVGAYEYNTGQGRVYIFYNDYDYGDHASTADEIITGETSNSFGNSLVAGDLNADGKTDLAVGANWSTQCSVYIFYNDGNYTSLASTADEIITGEASSQFGTSMSVGDLNSDGKEDLVVGAVNYSSYRGRSYIFYNDGSYAASAASADEIITGEASSQFGNSLDVGDLNSDGKEDLVVGAFMYNSFQGRIYIFYNDGTGIYTYGATTSNVTITGSGANFGESLVIGDMNSDDKTDLVVGATFYGSTNGRAYIFYNDGSYAASAASADEIITGEASSQFGTSMSVGDLNSDGKTDLIVGAKSFSSFTGRTYIFYNDGQYPLNATSADIMITGENNGDYFGIAMIVDDFTSDGKDDLLVGAYQYNNDTGKIYFYETRDNYSWELQPQLTNDFRILNHGGAELKITGEGGGAHFGYASAIGDLNADGKNDLVISAYSLSKVYIFYNDGSYANDAASADKIIIGDGDNFGYHLAIGDLNSDGNDDLVVGDYYYDMSGQCKVYIFYNDGAYVNDAASADKIITGDSWSFFGSYILISDLDADGDNDLAVNAWGYSSSRGRVYIFYNDGSYPATANSADEIITGENVGNKFGRILVSGDLDADGDDDLIAGAYEYDLGASTNEGRVYIFYNDGSYPTVATGADEIITGVAGSGFGYSLSVGNYNLTGTSTEDLVVGAPSYDLDLGTNTNEGRIYIFYNDETGVYPYGATSSDITITGEQGGFFGGTSFVNGIVSGDINNDSRTDIIISSIGYNSSQGCVYIFYNDSVYPWGATSADIILTGETIGSYYGSSLTTGDFNNDGKDDLAVGAYGYNSNQGRVYLYTFNDTVISGEGANNSFGNSLASGDFNGDGKGDLVVGASGYNSSQGRIYIFYNDSVMTNSAGAADVVISGEASSLFGHLLETGDLNADGKTDLVVGAWLYNSIQGRVYVFYGGESYPSSAASADEIITGESASEQFGYSIAVDDLNSDGKDDLIVGAWQYGALDNGRVYIFYNDGLYPTSAASADVKITGTSFFDYFGLLLKTGDLNADGKIDLLVARTDSANIIYIFYNDGTYPASSASADQIVLGEPSGRFGSSVVIGDINANGKEDLVISNSYYNSNLGRIYIFYNDGTGEYPYGATSSDVTITGSFLSEQFGISLQKGDLNSDGKTDLIVGARAYNSNQGRTYVFYNDGSYPDLSSGADIKLTGENTGDYFGASILTEDMNLDGINDLIVGAYGYNSSQGRVYIYTNETRAVDGFKKGEIRGNASFKGDVIIR